MIRILIFGLFSILFCTSCLQELEWKDATEPSGRLVVEGLITSEQKRHTVKLSRTREVIVEGQAPGVSGATVSISDGDQLFLLTETAPGIYQTDSTAFGRPGLTYYLKIELDREVYEAEAPMISAQPAEPIAIIPWGNDFPSPPNADYFQFIYRDNFGSPHPYQYQVYTEIPMNVADYYPESWEMPNWIRYELESGKKRVVDSTYYLHPGLEPPAILAYGEINESRITYGTKVVELFYSLTEEHYDFVRAVLSETEWQGLGPFGYVPADVPTNLSNGALGFFGASDVYRVEQVVR